MKNYFYTAFVLLLFSNSFGQSTPEGWKVEYSKSKSFIENKGQFDSDANNITGDIKYAIDFGATRIYFGEKGVSYNFRKLTKKSKEERAKIMAQPTKSYKDHKQKEKLVGKFLVQTDQVNLSWKKTANNCKIKGLEETSDYHSYSYNTPKGVNKSVNFVKGYNKLIYKNIYPNIDLEYEVHPIIGVKYSFVLHPGANLSDIDFEYDRDVVIDNGEIKISTLFGDIIDHAPITFYQENKQEIIESKYSLGEGSVSFDLSEYDEQKEVVIDPWVQTPNFNLDWDVVWECDRDAAGNVYIIGGLDNMQLIKYDALGTLQWTHNTPYDTLDGDWLGTFIVDDAGNSYVTQGVDARMEKVDALGNQIFYNANPSGPGVSLSTEFWTIAFNCDQTKLIVGGSGGAFDIHGRIYDVDMSTGDVNSSVMVTVPGGMFSIPPAIQEVRGMSAAPNGKYYFVTLDTIGYMADDFTLCPNNSDLYKTDNNIGWGYKSENWRANNTGMRVVRADSNYLYIHKGNELQRRSLTDVSIVQTVAIPNGVFQSGFTNQSANAGIDIDQCANIYVGSSDGVYVFNSSLVQTNFFATSFKVYDVRVSPNGDVIACGGTGDSGDNIRSGGVQTFTAAACAPITFSCCNTSVCIPETLCEQDSPESLIAATAGGTWSGTGVDASGNFDPAVAGPGTHNITYTLSCGIETIAITVDPCATIDICEEANGDLTASGGDGNYTWSEGTVTPTTTPITSEQECIDCPTATPEYVPIFGFYSGCDMTDCSTTDTVWTQYATGVTTSAPSGYPIQIVDGNGVTTVINNAGELVACATNPCTGVTITMNVDSQSDPNCFGGNNGAAMVSSTGGTAPYSYLWMPGSLSGDAQSALSAGTYNIAIQDDAGCTGTGTVTIGEPAELIASAVSTPASCGLNDGTATGSAIGGTGTLSYSWSPSGGATANATGLAPDTYTVTVTDQNMCTDDAVVDVLTTGGPTISLDNSADPLCFNGTDGSATVSATGGTASYTYSWMPGSLTGDTQSALSSDSYTVTVTDAGGCTDNIVVVIGEPTQISLSTSNIIDASCGSNDGGATVDAVGGTGAYSYSWSPSGGSSATATGIPGGSYTVTVTDINMCSEDITFTVPTLGGPTLTVQSTTDVSCYGLSDGEATIDASGGSTPYGYSWAPSGGTSNTASGLAAGTYTLTVTDAGGCISTESVTINEPTEILITETITDENCGLSDGAISIAASGGGNPTYSYLWSPGNEITNSISSLSQGSYSVTVTDGDGCTATGNYTVNQIGGLSVVATPNLSIIEEGEIVQITVTGATDYSWDPPTGLSCSDCSDPTASPLVTTVYVVTGTDATGCTGVDTVEIIVTPTPVDCGDIYVPNIFSPNSDNNNDYLCVYGDCVSELKFAVYNRWGELLYETESTISDSPGNENEICWDGTYKGKPLNSGVFAYKIYAKLLDNTIVEESGNITLVR